MIFGPFGNPARTTPELAARHADLLVPIKADVFEIIPRFVSGVNFARV
jgi:hypothetical protein